MNAGYTRLLLFHLFCLLPFLLSGQEVSYRHYTPDDGLASSEVYDAHQDKQGYLWFATDRGLCRYNGYNFEVFTVQKGLGDNVVFSIAEDRRGTLWFLTFSQGIYCYTEGRGFYPAAFNKQLSVITKNLRWVDRLVFDENNRPWFSIRDNESEDVFYYADEANTLKEIKIPTSIPQTSVLYAVGGDILFEKNILKNQPKKISLQKDNNAYKLQLPSQFIKDCIYLHNGDIACTIENLVIVINKDKIKKTLTVPAEILDLHTDDSHRLWVLTKNGAYVFDENNIDKPIGHYLSGKHITSYLPDAEGNHWFTTLDQGVYMVPSIDFKICSRAKVGSLLTFRDKLAGTIFPGNIFTIHKNEVVHPAIPVYNIPIDNICDYNPVAYDGDLIIDKNGQLIKNVAYSKAKCFIEIRKGWVFGNINGFRFFGRDKTVFQSKEVNFNLRVISVCSDGEDDVWLGTLFGLYKYSLKDNSINNLQFNQRINALAYNHATQIVIAGTAGGGLYFIKGNERKNLTEAEGLAGNYISTFLLQDTVLWVGTNKGFSRVVLGKNGNVGSIQTYSREDGLPSNEINAFAVYNKLLWIATNNGLVYIHPERLKKKQVKEMPVYITGVMVNEDAYNWDSEKLELGYDQRNLTINYSNIAFGNPASTGYFYKLEGLHTEWLSTAQKNVKFVNLPPGDYTFCIAAANGLANILPQHPSKIKIHIAKHFTQTWWFMSLTALVLLAIVAYGMLLFVQNHRRKLEGQRKMILSEQKALRAQMNPHFIFNALNSVQYYISENDKRSAGIFLSKFSSLIRSILENSNQSLIPLEEELACINKYLELEQLRFGNKFTYTVSVDPKIPRGDIKIPSMLIQPFLENAIWHGLMPKEGLGELLFSLMQDGNDILCVIEDNGIGRQKAALIKRNKQHNSSAIKNINERIQLIKMTTGQQVELLIEDLFNGDEPCGTKVTIRFHIKD